MRRLIRILGSALIAGLVAAGPGVAQDEKGYGKVNEQDAVFLRFPQLRSKYFGNNESAIARHKFIAMPMPKQCAYFYVDVYSTAQMSNHDTRREAARRCKENMEKYGPLTENYGVACTCELVIGRDTYRLPPEQLPTMGYAPVSVFYRNQQGGVGRAHGYAEFALQFRRGESGPLTVYNPAGTPVCTGTISIPGAQSGNFTLNCPPARFQASGQLQYQQGQPKEHTVGRGVQQGGGPVTIVIGLPSGAAQARYGTP